MNKIISKAAAIAVAGTMAFGVLAPAGAAFADGGGYGQGGYGASNNNNYYVLNNGGWGGSCGGGCGGYGGYANLGQLFVLGSLFAGPYGNGVISPYGTTLGDLLIVNQIARNTGFYY